MLFCHLLQVKFALSASGLGVGAINIRFPAKFLQGAFTNPDVSLRAAAVQLAAEGCSMAEELGATQVVVWSPYDGYDVHMQVGLSYTPRSFLCLCAFAWLFLIKPKTPNASTLSDRSGGVRESSVDAMFKPAADKAAPQRLFITCHDHPIPTVPDKEALQRPTYPGFVVLSAAARPGYCPSLRHLTLSGKKKCYRIYMQHKLLP